MALLANQIWQCLDLDLLDGSELLAEQLVANEDNADTRYLLGYVQYRRGQYETAKRVCQTHLQHAGCVWIYAQSCYKLEQAQEGCKVLDNSRKVWALENDLPLPLRLGRGELSPAAFHLLYAKLQALTNAEAAVQEYSTSVRLNPYLFENVIALCALTNVKVKTQTLFSRFGDPFSEVTAVEAQESAHPFGVPLSGPRHPPPSLHQDDTSLAPTQTVTSTPRQTATPRRILSTPMIPRGPNQPAAASVFAPSPSIHGSGLFTAGPGGGPGQGGGSNFSSILNGNMPGNRSISGQNGHGMFQTPTHGPPPNHNALANMATGNATGNPGAGAHIGVRRRKQDRMLSLSFRRQDQTSVSSLGKGIFASPRHESGPTLGSKAGVEALETIAEALELLSQSEFSEALSQVQSLSDSVRATPFVLSLKGRLLLELGKYSECVEVYELLRSIQPDRARDVEYLSTALWHLKRDSKLSMLGYEFTTKTSRLRRNWQSWCALGNAFSLRHDTQNAIRCFQRATKINPRSAYAYTLMGYEHIANDELENAFDTFGKAIQANPQHYNAWYGIGTVHYSLGQYDLAETKFAQAIRLNPNNTVLLCFMGAVLEASGKTAQALVQFERACQLDPSSPMPRYRKAEAYLESGMFQEALKELTEIEKIAPEDSAIHFAIARAHKGLGEGELAVQRFTEAQQLAPKMSMMIRKELDSI